MSLRRKKKTAPSSNTATSTAKKSKRSIDFDIESEEEEEEDASIQSSSSDDENEEIEETLDAKRIRLAREYLEKVRDDEEEESSSEEEDDDDRIRKKLARDRLIKEGHWEVKIADRVKWNDDDTAVRYWSRKAHDLSVTCVALHKSGQWGYSGSKDHSVAMWDVEKECCHAVLIPNWKKSNEVVHPRNKGEVLTLAASDDGRYLAVGGRDSLVKIFDVRQAGKESALITSFRGHKGPVTSLAFRSQSLDLYSGSEDRCIRHYTLDQMAYIETLYGHQSPITSLSCYRNETPISTSRDRTVRLWKLNQQTHLIYRAGSTATAADCACFVNHHAFVTGHDNADFYLWDMDRKKPLASVPNAHLSCGVISCDVLKGSDFAATGSSDGFLRFWKLQYSKTTKRQQQQQQKPEIDSIGSIPLHGHINGIAIGPNAKFCILAVGQEHRLGRWKRVAGAKNRVAFVPLTVPDDEDKEKEAEEEDDDESSDESSDESVDDDSKKS